MRCLGHSRGGWLNPRHYFHLPPVISEFLAAVQTNDVRASLCRRGRALLQRFAAHRKTVVSVMAAEEHIPKCGQHLPPPEDKHSILSPHSTLPAVPSLCAGSHAVTFSYSQSSYLDSAPAKKVSKLFASYKFRL